jgi:hypothetical protein
MCEQSYNDTSLEYAGMRPRRKGSTPAFLLEGTEQTRTKLEKLLQVFTGQRDYNTWRF